MLYLIVIKFLNSSGLIFALFGNSEGSTIVNWFKPEGLATNAVILVTF